MIKQLEYYLDLLLLFILNLCVLLLVAWFAPLLVWFKHLGEIFSG